jgi:hypothetical protein
LALAHQSLYCGVFGSRLVVDTAGECNAEAGLSRAHEEFHQTGGRLVLRLTVTLGERPSKATNQDDRTE